MASTISPSPLHLPLSSSTTTTTTTALSAGFRHLHSPPLPAAVVSFRHHRATRLVVSATAVIPTIERADAEKVHRLKSNYLEKIVPALSDELGYTNIHQVPKLVKIVVNCGMGDASQNSKGLESVIRELTRITGQKPVKTTAKNALASFKIREGQTIGVMITLRKNYMYSFLDRLINLALPRVKDFQGVNANSFDGNGNFNMGFREQSVFPEIKYDALVAQRGMDVCISTTAKTDKEAFRLLSLMGMPFKEGSSPSEKIPRKKKKHFNID